MATRKCKGRTKRGSPCKAAPLSDADYCLAHADEETRESTGFGGSQPGAGRPRSPRAVEVLRERLEADLDAWLAVPEGAREATRTVVVGYGEDAFTETVPDWAVRLRAFAEVFDRSYGKPRQAHEHSGANGAPVDVRVELGAKQREALADVLRDRPASSGD